MLELWRTYNPKGSEERESFFEMVQKGFAQKARFVSIITKVLQQWGLSPEQFCRHLAEKHPEGHTLTNSSFYSWMNNPEKHPNRESVATILEALVPESHREVAELMMWRAIKGSWPEATAYEREAEKAKKSGSTGELVTLLVESSGIPNARLQEMVGTQQLIPWKHGARIEDPEKADRFLALTNPPELKLFYETVAEVTAHNAEVSAVLTGRPLSVADALKRTSGIPKNQTGIFLQELIGRRGLVKKTDAEISEMIGVSVHMISHFKSGDGTPNEAQAYKFAALLSPITPEEEHAIVNRLTGIKTAKEMLDETWKIVTSQ